MYNQLLDHLKKYSILSEEQFGFRAASSTGNTIYKLINESLQALNCKPALGGISFDLENAFDCLNHEILMAKLHFYDVTGWFTLIIDIKEPRFW
jgi:hypothetical protein